MKKLCILIFFSLFLLTSCEKDISASDFMTDFARSYPLSGDIYLSEAEKDDVGYVSEELFRKIYRTDAEIPNEFAIYLNSRPERGAECGIFKLRDGAEKGAIIEMLSERIKLLSDRDTEGIILLSGNCIFYSTLDNPERAKEIFYRLIK